MRHKTKLQRTAEVLRTANHHRQSLAFTLRCLRWIERYTKPFRTAIGNTLGKVSQRMLRSPFPLLLVAFLLWGVARAERTAPILDVPLLLIAMALVFSSAVFGIVARLFPRQHHTLCSIMLLVLMVKMLLIGTAFQWWVGSPDEYSVYHHDALEVLQSWERGVPVSGISEQTYTQVLAAVYLTIGPHMQVGKLFNVLLLILAGLALFRIAEELFGARTAVVAFALSQFVPQITIWTTMLLRESAMLLVTVFTMLWLQRFAWDHRTITLPALLATAGLIMTAYSLRHYLGMMLMLVSGMVLITVLATHWYATRRPIALAFSALVILAVVIIQMQGKLDNPSRHLYSTQYLSIGTVQSARDFIIQNEPGKLYAPEVRLESIGNVLAFLPTAYFGILFLPFPSHVTSATTFAYYALSTLEYLLLPLMLVGIAVAMRTARRCYPLLLYALLTLTVYALAEPSIGNLVRHRIQANFLLLVFAALGWRYLTGAWHPPKRHGR